VTAPVRPDAAASARWEPGTVILSTYLHPDGTVEGQGAVRVVQHDETGLVTWQAPGSEVLWSVLANGAEVRTAPLAERFRQPWKQIRRRWRGQGVLRVSPADAPWTVWLFWTEAWQFRGWYVNLERPLTFGDHEVVTTDHILDIWVDTNRRWSWKDRDELFAATQAGRISTAEAAQIRRDGQAAVEVIERWGPPFSAGWERWRPDPAWQIPPLDR